MRVNFRVSSGFNPCLIVFESIEQTNRITRMKTNLTRAEFLRTGAKTLGAQEVVTERPLRLVLDRRPFI
jgi:hypothetical protein